MITPDYGLGIAGLYLALLCGCYVGNWKRRYEVKDSQARADLRSTMLLAHGLGIVLWLIVMISTAAGARTYHSDLLALVSNLSDVLVVLMFALLGYWMLIFR